ncbi:MAG: N-acetylmuramoyl-L-alanine amidase [Bacteroidia bacterium]|nr:N-acetylmuramoyl-L-alanine amidase [Bacteroidia bacterium]
MRFLVLIVLISISFSGRGQVTQSLAMKRFQYLNFHSSLNNLVTIDEAGVKIFASAAAKKSGKPEISISWKMAKDFGGFVRIFGTDTMAKMYENGTLAKLLKDQRYGSERMIGDDGPLSGVSIALDPGHIAGDMETAKIERKFLEFRANDTTGLKENVNIAEGKLAWETAMILKTALEKAGATVFITRKKIEYTAFGMSYDDWLLKRKKTVLDSLKNINKLTAAEHKNLMAADKEKFFRDFFKDHELARRIKTINKFDPDLSVIIHYNVDEKNVDWLKPGKKNFTMCFIGGGMTADNFKKASYKINFLRLLLTEDLEKSEKIAGYTVQEFSKTLGIPIAKKSDATYLEESCNATGTAGVYCRNLALCRAINSPLVYGECLYQDNFDECLMLNKRDKVYCGITTNERVKQVADCYEKAILKYFAK